MLNVIWDISTVLNPRDMPKAMNASIREIPVTISAFSMGMLVMPITTVFGTALMELMEMAAAVPMMVAMSADTKAMTRVVVRALMMERLSNIWVYHCRVNPPHWVLDLDLLKESTIMVRMGAYRKISISTI